MLTIFYINSTVWFYVEYKCWNDVWRINAGAKRKKCPTAQIVCVEFNNEKKNWNWKHTV